MSGWGLLMGIVRLYPVSVRMALVVTCLWALPLGARAQEAGTLDELARHHFMAGSSYYDAGDYAGALREFETAYEMSGRAALLYNLYLAHERLGHVEEAAENLRGYLERGEVPETRRPVLEQRLQNLQARIASADGEEAAATAPVVDPGTAAGPGPADTGDGGASSTSTITLVAFVTAGAGLAAAGVFGALALAEHGSLDGSDGCAPGCTDDDVSTLRAYNVVADVGLGVALVGAVVGALLLATGDGDDEEGASATAWLSPDGGGIGVRGAL